MFVISGEHVPADFAVVARFVATAAREAAARAGVCERTSCALAKGLSQVAWAVCIEAEEDRHGPDATEQR